MLLSAKRKWEYVKTFRSKCEPKTRMYEEMQFDIGGRYLSLQVAQES